MYYYHILWFILLSLILIIFFVRNINHTIEKTKSFYTKFTLISLLLVIMFVYVYKNRYNINYVLIPFEKYFIILLFIFSLVNIFLLTNFTRKKQEEVDAKLVNIFISILVVFLLLCLLILFFPDYYAHKSIREKTDYEDFRLNILNPFQRKYNLDLPL